MISFDNSFFFEKDFLNFNTSSTFQKNLELSLKKYEKLYIEIEEGKSEILNSFTKKYQKKITKLKERIKYKEKKIVIGLGGSSSGAKALSFFINDKIVYFDNLDYKFTKKFFSEKNLSEYTFFIIS